MGITQAQDFQDRCEALTDQLDIYMRYREDSPRVWVCVLTHVIACLVKEQEDPEGALEQAISAIKKSYQEKD